MNKCIAVIDIPESCFMCHFSGQYVVRCELCGSLLDTNRYKKRMKWCPLKEIPERKPELQMDIIHSESIECGYYNGWNACIDEIVGGK